MSLKGKKAVVTGAASGIGRASAVRLAQDGADVAVVDLNEEGLLETAKLVEAEGRNCMVMPLDLLDRPALRAAFDKIKSDLGFIEILHNNAGGTLRKDMRRFVKAEDEQWDYMIGLNLTVAADCCREVVGDMKERKAGRIISTSSEQAFRADFFTDYSAAKAGLIGFTKSLALELAPHNVTVNAICPGVTRTPIVERMPKDRVEQSLKSIPIGRMAEPEEIAGVVSFLAGPDASYVTGEHIMVTGGRTLR